MVNTKKVARRTLRFSTLDETLAEAQRIADAARAGSLQQLGNWSPGQAFGHLAGGVNFRFDGYPKPAPWYLKLLVRPLRGFILARPFKPGLRVPGIKGGTNAIDVLPLDEGLARFIAATNRLKAQAPPVPNAVFGPLTHDEWITYAVRHSELHLSFFRYGGDK